MLSILDIVSANTIYYCYPALVPTSKRVYGDSAVSENPNVGNSHTNCIACEFAHEKNVHVLTLETHTQKRKTLARFLYILLHHIIISLCNEKKKHILSTHTLQVFFSKANPTYTVPTTTTTTPMCFMLLSI